MKNLIDNAACLFRSKMVGLVEFKFENLSLINSIKIEGDVDLNVELFATNNNHAGHKIITHRDTLKGEDVEYVFDKPVYANNIILTSTNIKDSLKIKKLTVEGQDCMEERLITKNRDEIKSLLNSVNKCTHITKDNYKEFNLNNFIYMSEECIDDDTLNTIERLIILKELCNQTNKNLIMNKNWLCDCFEDIAQYTCDVDMFDEIDMEIIVEKNADLRTKASHKLRLYDLASHKLLTDELNTGILHVLYKRHLKLGSAIKDKIAEFDIKKYKDSYTICYYGTDNINIIKNMIVHYPYETILRLLNNLIEDSYVDKNDINIHITTDEIPLMDYIKDKFDLTSSIDSHRYDINTSGLKVSLESVNKDESFKGIVEKKAENYKVPDHKQLLIDLGRASKSKQVILSGDKYSSFVKVIGDKKLNEYIDMNYVFAREKF